MDHHTFDEHNEGHFESEEKTVQRPIEVALGPRSCVSISQQLPSIVQQQVSIKNKDAVHDGAFIIAKHNSVGILCCSDPIISFPPLQTASEWWHLTVVHVDTLEKAPR